LPDKAFCDVLGAIWRYSLHFKIFIYVVHNFPRNPSGRSAKPFVGYAVMKSLVYHEQTACMSRPLTAFFQGIHNDYYTEENARFSTFVSFATRIFTKSYTYLKLTNI
jgi:hypothetical protein